MFNHTFPEDGFKSEKEVVKEEISMYEDNSKSFVIDKIYEEIFENYKNRENYLSSLFFCLKEVVKEREKFKRFSFLLTFLKN